MQKRGLQEVVSTVLIILIAIVGVSIIAITIIPLIQDTLSSDDLCVNVLGDVSLIKSIYSCYSPSATSFSVINSNPNIEGFIVIIKDGFIEHRYEVKQGSSYPSIPGPGLRLINQTYGQELVIPYGKALTYVFEGSAEKIDIYPILGDSGVCSLSDSLSFLACSVQVQSIIEGITAFPTITESIGLQVLPIGGQFAIAITSPQNITYTTPTAPSSSNPYVIDLDFTLGGLDDDLTCEYVLDSGSPVSVDCGLTAVQQLSITSAGSHTITASAQNSTGATVSSSVTFSVIQSTVSTIGHNFQFWFTDNGLMEELNWTDGQTWKRVSWDEVGRFPTGSGQSHYLHSGETDLEYINPSGSTVTLSPTYQKDSETSDTVVIKTFSTALSITDTITFSGDTMYIQSSVKNELSQPITAIIPFNIGGLQVGNLDSSGAVVQSPTSAMDLKRMRADKGGNIESNFIGSGPLAAVQIKYPKEIQAFAPVSALWDSNKLTVGVQYLTELHLPDYVSLTEKAWNQYTPSMLTTLNAKFLPGQTRTFTFAISVANGGGSNWRNTLDPYQEWFYDNYGEDPSYCPTGAFAWAQGSNSCGYTPPVWKSGPEGQCPEPNPAEQNRFYPNTQFMNVYGYHNTLANIQTLKLKRFGIWQPTLHSSHLTSSCSTNPACTDTLCCEYSPNAELIDPRLDIAQSTSAWTNAINAFSGAGAELFWYTRTCSNIQGLPSSITAPDGPYSQGTFAQTLDLTNPSIKAQQFSKYQYLYSKGISDFYMDYISCAGEDDLIANIQGLGNDVRIIREGARDRDLYQFPGAPILKTGTPPTYSQSNSELIEWLVPDATYYGGFFNNILTESETDTILSKGYQPVITNNIISTDVSTTQMDKWKEWMCKSYENQLERYNNYGSSIPGCSAPVDPGFSC